MLFRVLGCLPLLFLASITFGRSPDLEDAMEGASRLARSWQRPAVIEAIETYDKIANRSFAIGEWSQGIEALLEESRLLGIANDRPSSIATLERARAIGSQKGLAELLIVVEAELIVARAYTSPGFATAEALRSLDPQRVSEARYRSSIWEARGTILSMRQEDAASAEAFERALELVSGKGNHRVEAELRTEMGIQYLFSGRIDMALGEFEKALAIGRDSGDPRVETFALFEIGVYYATIGDNRTGLDYYLAAEQRFPKGLDGETHGALLNGIAHLYERFNAFAETVRYQELSLASMRDAGSTQGVVDTLYFVSRTQIQLGRIENAESALQQCIDSATLNNMRVTEKLCRLEMGKVRLMTNRLSEAESDFLRAKDGLDGYPLPRGWALSGLGDVSLAAGNLALASRRFEEALDYCRKMRLGSVEADVLYRLGKVKSAMGRTDEALEFLRQSIESSEKLANDVGSDRLQTTYVEGIFERYEFLIKQLLELNDSRPGTGLDREALKISERVRARVLRESIELNRGAAPEDSDLMKRKYLVAQRINVKLTDLSAALERKAPQSEVDAIDREIVVLKNERDDISRQIKERNPFFSALTQGLDVDLDDLRARLLDDRTVAVEYFLGEEASAMWLITRSGVRMEKLPPRPVIARLVNSLRTSLRNWEIRSDDTIESLPDRRAENEREFFRTSAELSDLLLRPFASEIGSRRVIIIPDGELHLLPFAALPSPGQSSGQVLVESNNIVIEHSLATYKLLSERRREEDGGGRRALVVADPVFGPGDERLSGVGVSERPEPNRPLARLIGSGDEARAVVDALGGSQVSTLNGFEANRRQFLDAGLGQFSIVHLATHADSDERRADLSGMIFSRYSSDGHRIDETLRLGDIYGLRLNADLVVLSACETGTGDQVRGEGLESIANGFVAAGSRSVVSSMWRIEDSAAKELMSRFYRELATGDVSTSEALRRAQLGLRRDPQFRFPYYWASFTLLGDPDSKPYVRGAVRYEFALPLLIPLFAGLFYYLKRLNDQSTVRS